MSDRTEHILDTVVLVTGVDSMTGSITCVGVKNDHRVGLKAAWADGIIILGFSNMFALRFPRASAPFSTFILDLSYAGHSDGWISASPSLSPFWMDIIA
jgi:hypothetical protein